jgi:hypothetical protein
MEVTVSADMGPTGCDASMSKCDVPLGGQMELACGACAANNFALTAHS